MSCSLENREERLMDYLSGSLETAEAALFEKHIESCAACGEFVHGQKAVWEALDLFGPAPVSPAFDRALYERIAQTSRWSRFVSALAAPFRAPAFLRQGLPLMGAAALIAAGVVVWEHPGAAPAPVPTQTAAVQPAPTLQAADVQRALDDMDMLREFNHLVVTDSAQSKM